MKTLFVSSGLNSVHERMAEYIGADKHHIKERVTKEQNWAQKLYSWIASSDIPTGYDITLCESNYQYPALKKNMLMLNSKLINMNCGAMAYNLTEHNLGILEERALKTLMSQVDGYLVLGSYGAELLSRLNTNKPFRRVYPFVTDQRYAELAKIRPNLESKTITCIARDYFRYKGLDILLNSFKQCLESDKDLKLNIISQKLTKKDILPYAEGIPEKNLSIHENPKDITKILEQTSLYVQPSRGDTFPVASIEAMASGIPTIVSDHTGTKEIVKRVEPEVDDGERFIFTLNPKTAVQGLNNLTSKIRDYFDTPLSERQKLSGYFREQGVVYTEEDTLELFKTEYLSLVEEVME